MSVSPSFHPSAESWFPKQHFNLFWNNIFRFHMHVTYITIQKSSTFRVEGQILQIDMIVVVAASSYLITLSLCLTVRLSIHWSITLPLCQSIHPSVHPFLFLSILLYVCLSFLSVSVHLFVFPPVSLSIHLAAPLSVCLSVCVSICMHACMYVCMSLSLSVCSSICLSFSRSVPLSVGQSICLLWSVRKECVYPCV